MLDRLRALFRPTKYPLASLQNVVAGGPVAVASLDLGRGVITHRAQIYPVQEIERLHLFPVPPPPGPFAKHNYLGVKLRLGPIFCFEKRRDDATTRRLAKSIATSLGVRPPETTSWTGMYLYDALATLRKGRIEGNVGLSRVRFYDGGLSLPLALCIEDADHVDAYGDLVIDRDGIRLYNGLGESRKLGEFSKLLSVRTQAETIFTDDSEHKRVTLEFVLDGPPSISLGFNFASSHDYPIPGEAQMAARQSSDVNSTVARIRRHLGLAG
ncbi:MAG: hypothetical protein KC910_03185 [Candidatus Eremiobacteraeota bacterium]|nr:hypothetical protein [Candidatus Eremiobacteraeota bacterium]